jgi:hypothetical protein
VNKQLSIKAGLSVILAAEGTDATGNRVTVTPTWTVGGDIGTITPNGQFTAGQIAGRRGTIVATARGVQDTLRVTILPGSLSRITITPASVTVRPNQLLVFRATGFDAFNNRVTIRPLWHVVGGIGTIDKRIGLFRAGTRTGTGYVIAYADSVFGDAGATLSGSAKVAVEQGFPTTYTLSQNYPNPFNPETAIDYDLPDVAYVRIRIYDLSGQEIHTLVHHYHHPPGHYTIVWDGRDAEGRAVASGVYLYRLEVLDRGFVETKRMLLVR